MIFPDFVTFIKLAREGKIIPVYREVLADTETPVSLLMKLSTKDYLFLLESVEGGEKWGRYTFVGADPQAIFRIGKKTVTIEERGRITQLEHKGKPLPFLRKIMGTMKPALVEGCPRFFGGAVGFFAYDMVRYFEKLPARCNDDLKTYDAVFLLTDTIFIFDNVRHTIKIVACATVNNTDLKEAYKTAERKIEELASLLRKPFYYEQNNNPKEKGENIAWKSNLTQIQFEEMVKKAKNYILAGDIIQVVLSQRFEMTNHISSIDLYRALRYINPSPYLFFLKLNDLCLIGSSPEVMVRLENNVLELRPIAGTRKRGKTEQEDRLLADELLNDPKECAEHVMLVDLGRNDLGRVAAVGTVQVTQLMAVERYSHVMHLVSNIQAQLAKDKDAFDVLCATFPAGTLTGAPKIRAMEIIDELEPTCRGPYGGAVGYFSFNGNMDFCITIRTIMLKGDKLYLQAGAGIVADSVPEREYQETINKAEGMKQAIILALNGFNLAGQG